MEELTAFVIGLVIIAIVCVGLITMNIQENLCNSMGGVTVGYYQQDCWVNGTGYIKI